MKVIAIINTVFYVVQFALGENNFADRYCFQFTWLGEKYDQNSNGNKPNCSIPTPCMEPFIITDDSTRPNVTHMWNIDFATNRSAISCPLRPGYVCIKYSYSFNNAILNTTYFCGKMIEKSDNEVLDSAINTGCFTQKINGHIIEACACQSNGGHMPCNNSSRINLSLMQIIIGVVLVLFLQKIIKLM
ncbi:hypothetical protein PV325_007296 [Microctonus aethiopoides]|uniref:Uncharacterized protein n=1 Tax=Microctonus aethiopoides TaxID=144406 RepID=A0AA39C6V0_9HYME|nr:hypothetical protein PV325_007296 [Microctonus aethiopoides]KAK0158933.1 hypothetical protein PV328_009868 [Microctonus aethiopoides]